MCSSGYSSASENANGSYIGAALATKMPVRMMETARILMKTRSQAIDRLETKGLFGRWRIDWWSDGRMSSSMLECKARRVSSLIIIPERTLCRDVHSCSEAFDLAPQGSDMVVAFGGMHHVKPRSVASWRFWRYVRWAALTMSALHHRAMWFSATQLRMSSDHARPMAQRSYLRIPGGWAPEPPEACKSIIPDQTPWMFWRKVRMSNRWKSREKSSSSQTDNCHVLECHVFVRKCNSLTLCAIQEHVMQKGKNRHLDPDDAVAFFPPATGPRLHATPSGSDMSGVILRRRPSFPPFSPLKNNTVEESRDGGRRRWSGAWPPLSFSPRATVHCLALVTSPRWRAGGGHVSDVEGSTVEALAQAPDPDPDPILHPGIRGPAHEFANDVSGWFSQATQARGSRWPIVVPPPAPPASIPS